MIDSIRLRFLWFADPTENDTPARTLIICIQHVALGYIIPRPDFLQSINHRMIDFRFDCSSIVLQSKNIL